MNILNEKSFSASSTDLAFGLRSTDHHGGQGGACPHHRNQCALTASVVDTLKYCVINANSIAVMNASFPKEKNITREVSFKVKNKEGEGKTVNSTITGVAEWNGVKCYTVLLDVGMNFQTHKVYRKVDCILADLEKDEFKLYVGKNWLGDDMKLK